MAEQMNWKKFDPLKKPWYVSHGFILAYYHLMNDAGYEKAIKETIMLGGNLGKNCAIVGGLLGARDGVQDLITNRKVREALELMLENDSYEDYPWYNRMHRPELLS